MDENTGGRRGEKEERESKWEREKSVFDHSGMIGEADGHTSFS